MNDYTGWTFRHGILTGNLPEGCNAKATAARLESALAGVFPGATIEVPVQTATGCIPHGLKPTVFSPDPAEPPQTSEYPGPELESMESVWDMLELVYGADDFAEAHEAWGEDEPPAGWDDPSVIPTPTDAF
jgi:hypothetical protein